MLSVEFELVIISSGFGFTPACFIGLVVVDLVSFQT